MVADFVLADLGWLASPDQCVAFLVLFAYPNNHHRSEWAWVLFKAGKAHNGYYTNEDILTQITKAIDILNKYYSKYTHVFAFDNATTHMKCRSDALSARHMVVNPPNAKKPDWLCTVKDKDSTEQRVWMNNRRFYNGESQCFYFPDDHQEHPGCFKGIREIVQDQYEKHTPGIPNPTQSQGKQLNGKCKNFQCTPC